MALHTVCLSTAKLSLVIDPAVLALKETLTQVASCQVGHASLRVLVAAYSPAL